MEAVAIYEYSLGTKSNGTGKNIIAESRLKFSKYLQRGVSAKNGRRLTRYFIPIQYK